jgi:hypothetical protein
MGLRFLAAAALLVILAFVVRGWLRRFADKGADFPRPSLTRTVRCERCGAYVPRSAAVKRGGAFYCSDRHAPAKPDPNADV